MKTLEALALSVLAVFAPIKMIIIVVGIVILVDLITGILAARKRKEKITSAAIRRTVSKILIYQTAILTGFLIETYLIENLLPITKLVAGVIGATEGFSIFENLNVLSGNNIFRGLIEKLGSVNDLQKPESEEQPKP